MKRFLFFIFLNLSCTIIFAQPVIHSFLPQSGPIGTTVVITGANFDPIPSNNIVFLGAVRAIVTMATSSLLSVVVPTAATNSPITVTTNGLTAYSNFPFIVTFPSPGTGFTPATFSSPAQFDAGGGPMNTINVDMDSDGKPDILTLNITGTISVVKNISTPGIPNFNTKTDYIIGGTRSFTTGDIDGDGKPDIIVTSAAPSNKISIFRNTSSTGNISLGSRIDIYTTEQVYAVYVSDFDADGKPDIIVGGLNTPNIAVLPNTSTIGAISFASFITFTTTQDNSSLIPRDLDADGKPDIAATDRYANQIALLKNNSTPGNINFETPQYLPAGDIPFFLDAGDIDGDGKLDLVGFDGNNSDSVFVYRNTSANGILSFSPRVNFKTGLGQWFLEIYDLNGDGKQEIVFVTAHIYVGILQNTSVPGTVSFEPHVLYQFLNSPVPATGGLTVGDIDGDGLPDICAVNRGHDRFFILLNQNATIPLTLLNFQGGRINKDVHLNWQTASEQNTSHFIVEHATNGNTFSPIGSVIASHNSNSIRNYSFSDASAKPGENFYRLKMLDIDQSYSYSKTISIKMPEIESGVVVSAGAGLNSVNVTYPTKAESKICIIDMSGRIIKSITLKTNSSNTAIDLAGITTGVYILSWSDKTSMVNKRFVKY